MNILSPGNGPSGIALSYMLSGNWPYYVGQSHDEFLHSRLMLEPHLSLVDQDLEFLSEVRIIFIRKTSHNFLLSKQLSISVYFMPLIKALSNFLLFAARVQILQTNPILISF